ncbi:hypothetical protein C6502_10650 [Candidatus Poribacteria bacterium]|nr:MAG: hypothetical protein C6502_10650 [Candidatus Poribacteria bacterium]
MGANAMQLLEECIERLRKDRLTEAHLRDLGSVIMTDNAKQQHLLYLQTATTAVTSEVIGMLMVKDGAVSDGPFDYADWPYKTVLDAINEGWRVIRFPVQLPVGHTQDTHITCEFILEKWE